MTPLILLELVLVTGLPLSDIVTLIFMDIAMFVTLLVGALVTSAYKWGYYAFARAYDFTIGISSPFSFTVVLIFFNQYSLRYVLCLVDPLGSRSCHLWTVGHPAPFRIHKERSVPLPCLALVPNLLGPCRRRKRM